MDAQIKQLVLWHWTYCNFEVERKTAEVNFMHGMCGYEDFN